jgi:hypothetical protein
MADGRHLTAVEAARARRRWLAVPVAILLALALAIGLVVLVIGAVLAVRYSGESTPRYADEVEHFKYGSIGTERGSGIPYRVWRALPELYPDVFAPADERGDGAYAVFGFLYEEDSRGTPRDLPIGISRRTVNGVELVWFNCAVCHTGTWRIDAAGAEAVQWPDDADWTDGARRIVAGMPSNNLDLHRFIEFLLSAATDERLAPDTLLAAIEATSGRLGFFERLLWRHYVIPALREGLLVQHNRLGPLLGEQPDWGPGRVDTFNPYKLIQLNWPLHRLEPAERIGTADFPSVFLQGPREGMQLHWDGNNPSLAERNLSAAVGGGLDLDTATAEDHRAIERVAYWLRDLEPPPSPMRLDRAADGDAIARGKASYMARCADCHGYRAESGYMFEGDRLGAVVPIDEIRTDPARLDSYTDRFREAQRRRLGFDSFVKTDGYANHPLDGLWLRGPYLHNGSVPTLYDLLQPPEDRPVAFLRGSDAIDPEKGGFRAEPCVPGEETPPGLFCFDTRLPGNGNGGHLYGTRALSDAEKADLLAYLRTF